MNFHAPRISTFAFALLATSSLVACDTGGGEDDDHGHHEHGETHHHEGSGGEGMESDPESVLEWQSNVPITVAAGTEFDAGFTVETTGEIHVTEIRVCMGADVTGCGMGDMDSFDMSFPAEDHGAHYHAEMTLDTAGAYTLVAYAHIGENPHHSEIHNLTVE